MPDPRNIQHDKTVQHNKKDEGKPAVADAAETVQPGKKPDAETPRQGREEDRRRDADEVAKVARRLALAAALASPLERLKAALPGRGNMPPCREGSDRSTETATRVRARCRHGRALGIRSLSRSRPPREWRRRAA